MKIFKYTEKRDIVEILRIPKAITHSFKLDDGYLSIVDFINFCDIIKYKIDDKLIQYFTNHVDNISSNRKITQITLNENNIIIEIKCVIIATADISNYYVPSAS